MYHHLICCTIIKLVINTLLICVLCIQQEVGEKSALEIIKDTGRGVVKCRICKEDHWTTNCPYKDTLGPLRDSLAGTTDQAEGDATDGADGKAKEAGAGAPAAPGAGGAGGKYVPPNIRAGGRGESMPDRKRSKDDL